MNLAMPRCARAFVALFLGLGFGFPSSRAAEPDPSTY
jgi:hypothetical protein